MYEPLWDVNVKRHEELIRITEIDHRLRTLKAARPGMMDKVRHSLGHLLVNWGTRLHENANVPGQAQALSRGEA